jgi:uncharacterized protein (DUF983 family)
LVLTLAKFFPMSESKPSLLGSIFKMKCPNCRKGNMFSSPSIFPLNKLLDMPEHCEHCGQKMELEVGFYYGTGYVSYALSVFFLALYFVLYWIFFGLSYDDMSIFYALGVSVVFVVLMQPWLMRISRVIYLYIFVKYGKGSIIQSKNIS